MVYTFWKSLGPESVLHSGFVFSWSHSGLTFSVKMLSMWVCVFLTACIEFMNIEIHFWQKVLAEYRFKTSSVTTIVCIDKFWWWKNNVCFALPTTVISWSTRGLPRLGLLVGWFYTFLNKEVCIFQLLIHVSHSCGSIPMAWLLFLSPYCPQSLRDVE